MRKAREQERNNCEIYIEIHAVGQNEEKKTKKYPRIHAAPQQYYPINESQHIDPKRKTKKKSNTVKHKKKNTISGKKNERKRMKQKHSTVELPNKQSAKIHSNTHSQKTFHRTIQQTSSQS